MAYERVYIIQNSLWICLEAFQRMTPSICRTLIYNSKNSVSTFLRTNYCLCCIFMARGPTVKSCWRLLAAIEEKTPLEWRPASPLEDSLFPSIWTIWQHQSPQTLCSFIRLTNCVVNTQLIAMLVWLCNGKICWAREQNIRALLTHCGSHALYMMFALVQ